MKIYLRLGKPYFDRLVALTALILLAPVIAVIAILVRLKLGTPVLFRQQRPGHYCKPFTILKFRTMTDTRNSAGVLLPDAQRLTPFGRFLRSTSLDELPELWNVLIGEMSLVGPRPLRMKYLPLYNEHQVRRHEVRPGITGWAQVNGRNSLTWKERFDLDVWYVENVSFGLDLQILLLTVLAVVKREGLNAEGHATMYPFTGSPPAPIGDNIIE